MATTRIVEAVDVFKDGDLGLPSRFPRPPPDELSLDGLEKRLDSAVVVAISLVADRYFEAVLPQDLLIIVRAVLRPAIRMVDAAFGRRPGGHGHVERTGRQVAFHSVAHGPTNDAPGTPIKDDSQVKPAFLSRYSRCRLPISGWAQRP